MYQSNAQFNMEILRNSGGIEGLIFQSVPNNSKS